MMPTGKSARELRPALLPFPLPRLLLVGVEGPEMAYQGMADIFGHLYAHASIVQPHHLPVRRQAQLQQLVDPGTDIEDSLDPRLLVDELLRWRPDHAVIGNRIAALPCRDIRAGQQTAQTVEPGCRVDTGITQGDAQGHQLASFNSSAPSVTWSPGANSSSPTVPSAGAEMVCSIFIASITASACPRRTLSPALTANDNTLPGIGAVKRPVSAWWSPAWASRSIARMRVAPRGVNT
jgi:hypothetical protein